LGRNKKIAIEMINGTSDNTAYTLRANALALRDIAPFGRNVVYAGDVIQHPLKNRRFEK
jgi:hypothetical protein